MENNRLTHKPESSRFASLRPLDPDLPDMLWRIIVNYRPMVPASQWEACGEFVISTVLATKPRTYENTRRVMSMTARFVCWTWTVTGCTLSPDKVFTDSHSRRFISDQLAARSPIYQWGVARQLSVISETVNGSELFRPAFGARRGRTAPYSTAELATMNSWANALPTAHKRRNARAILALGGGAGLTAAEVMVARVEDVEILDGVTYVTVRGSSPRRVPMLGIWTRTLTLAIAGTSHGLIFVGHRFEEYPPRSLQTFLTENRGKVRPSSARLKCNFVVALLDAHLPVQIIMDAAGFTSAHGLDPYLRFAKSPNISDFTSAIVGTAVNR
ncbi:MAG: hypothetical protein JWQ39_2155 [Glaciihabitans sp.]|nr:hypothetical protein [Glaciihabitans sp.]